MTLKSKWIDILYSVATGSRNVRNFFTPLFIWMNVWELKSIEEPELEKRLSIDYIEYRKQTPMFFPRIRILSKRRK